MSPVRATLFLSISKNRNSSKSNMFNSIQICNYMTGYRSSSGSSHQSIFGRVSSFSRTILDFASLIQHRSTQTPGQTTVLKNPLPARTNPLGSLTFPAQSPAVDPLSVPPRFIINPLAVFFVCFMRAAVVNGVHQVAGFPISSFPNPLETFPISLAQVLAFRE